MDHPRSQFDSGQHKKPSKNAKEKMKAKEQQRYLKKVENYNTHQNIDVTQEKKPPNKSSHADERIKDEDAKLQEKYNSADHPGLIQLGSDVKMVKEKQNLEEDKNIVLPPSTVLQPQAGFSPPSAGTCINDDDVLEEHDIFRLKKKSSRFPKAMFYCRLCNYHLDTLALCMKHCKEQRHSNLEKNKNNLKEIESIEAPCEVHAEALTMLLKATVAEIAFKDGDLKRRSLIADSLQLLLQRAMPDVKVNLYGSSLSGFGFHDSDVNLGIETPEGTIQSQILVRAFEALIHEDTCFDDVRSNFEERFPCIRFIDKESGFRCELSTCTSSLSALKTSKLLAEYRQLDPRVHLLALVFRYWARLCGLDSQSNGSMPACSYVLMTIFFLQHCNPPVVPVLQENESLECKNADTLGELWIKMLQFYTIEVAVEEIVISVRNREPISREELKIPNRRLVIEDPIATNKKNIAKSLSSNTVFQYLIDRLQQALLYFGKPQKDSCTCRSNAVSGSKATETTPCKIDTSSKDVAVRTNSESSVDTVTNNVDTSNTSIQTTNQFVELNTEDQLSRLEQSSIDNNCVSGGVPKQSMPSGLSRNSQLPPSKDSAKCILKAKAGDDSDLESACSRNTIGIDSDIKVSLVINAIEKDDSTSDDDLDGHLNTVCVQNCSVQDGDDTRQQQEKSILEADTQTDISKSEISHCHHHFRFAFTEEILTGGKKVVIVCNGCGKEGHKVAECPDETLPVLVSLPPMDKAFLKRIDALCRFVEDQFGLKDLAAVQRDRAVASYERTIRNHGYSNATLELFGSSRNGFGFAKSDMDICLKFQNIETAENLDIPNIIEDLAKKLKRHSYLHHIIPISTAKVPIVKFVDPYMQIDVDVSLYNCLAQANTHMLYMYSKLDPRVRQLVYTAKVFAKMCDIGDASKGSLSSYAYTIMTIFFLQQRKPPVLPVLQELYDGNKKPEILVEGWNAWFFSDLKKLRHIWRNANQESVGELWLGFLHFFAEEFSSKKHVVCIRQHKPVSRFEKMWTGSARGFAIEDPFDLDHNLGSGVSRKMATFIMQVFIRTREHFGTPKRRVGYRSEFEYFFDTFVLTGGEAPPNDRCCRVCGKIGHFLKDCPRRKGHKETGRSRDGDEDAKKRRDGEMDRNKAKRDQAANDADSSTNVKEVVPKQKSTKGAKLQRADEVAVVRVPANGDKREASQDATKVKSTIKQGTPKTSSVSTAVLYSQGSSSPMKSKIGDNWHQHLEEKKHQKNQEPKRKNKADNKNKKELVPVTSQNTATDHSAQFVLAGLDQIPMSCLPTTNEQQFGHSQSAPSNDCDLSSANVSTKNGALAQRYQSSCEPPNYHQQQHTQPNARQEEQLQRRNYQYPRQQQSQQQQRYLQQQQQQQHQNQQHQHLLQQEASTRLSQNNQTYQDKEQQFNVYSGQSFLLASSNTFAVSPHPNLNLSLNEKPRTLQEIEEIQLKKLKQQDQDQEQPNLTTSGQDNDPSQDLASPLHYSPSKFLSAVAKSPPFPERIQGSPVRSPFQTSTPGMNTVSAAYGVSPEAVWGFNTSLGAIRNSRPRQSAHEERRLPEESNIGTALLQGVSRLQNREGGRRNDAFDVTSSGPVKPEDGDCQE